MRQLFAVIGLALLAPLANAQVNIELEGLAEATGSIYVSV